MYLTKIYQGPFQVTGTIISRDDRAVNRSYGFCLHEAYTLRTLLKYLFDLNCILSQASNMIF